MPFNNELPEWNKTATAPTTTKKNAGWTAGEKPPASIFDWFFNTTYLALKELQEEAAPKETAQMVKLTQDNGYIKSGGVVDLNTITDIWTVVSSTSSNIPLTGFAWYVNTISESATGRIQFAFTNSTTQRMFWRRYAQSVGWGAWNEIATSAQEGWISAALSNSWVNLSGYTTSYRKTNYGKIAFKGAISGGTNATGTTLFTLPVGYRPVVDTTIGIFNTSSAGVANGAACLTIEATTGSVKFFGTTAPGRIYLDGIEFWNV